MISNKASNAIRQSNASITLPAGPNAPSKGVQPVFVASQDPSILTETNSGARGGSKIVHRVSVDVSNGAQ